MKPLCNASKYTYVVAWSADDEAYVARVAEFKSLAAHGDTAASALTEIQEVVKIVLIDLEENGEPIPQPLSETKYSGKFILRMTPSLHRRLAEQASLEGVSLNQFVNQNLAKV